MAKEDKSLERDIKLQHELEKEQEHQEEADEILLNDPLAYLLKEVSKDYIGDTPNVTMCIYSIMSLHPGVTSLLHLQHVGKPQSGKSHLCNTCESLISAKMRFHVKHQSPMYLMYASNSISVKDTLMIFDDASERDIGLLKSLGGNSGPPDYATVVNGKDMEMHLDAEPLVWFSTVAPLRDKGGQLSSRYVLLNTNDSDEHHSKILDALRDKVNQDNEEIYSPISYTTRALISSCIQNTSFDIVKVPSFEYPDKIDTPLRDANGYISLIQSIAVLNHRNRVIRTSDNALLATQDDVDTAAELWAKLAPYNRMKLSKPQKAVYDAIVQFDQDSLHMGSNAIGITAKGICEATGYKSTTVYDALVDLQQMEFIEKEGDVYYPV